MDTLGVRLKYYRKEVLNLTQAEFAEKVGVSQGNMTHWETDKVKPDAESLTKIIMAFPRLNPAWLVFDIGAMEIPTINGESSFLKEKVALLEKVTRLQERIEDLTSNQQK